MSLQGVRVAVTRTPAQASELIRLLEAEGARVVAYPLIRVEAHDPAALAAVLARGSWDWVVFTSVNAVRLSAAALRERSGPALGAALRGARIACVGPATADSAAEAGLRVDTIPDEHVGAAVAAAMGAQAELRGARVLWPRGAGAADTVAASLRAAGAHVTAPVAYRTLADDAGARGLARAILQGAIDVVTFTSPSAVRSLTEALQVPSAVRTVVIGPVTAEAARAAGYAVDGVAMEPTAAGVVDVLRTLYG